MTKRGHQLTVTIVAFVFTVATWFLTSDEKRLLLAVLNTPAVAADESGVATTTAYVTRVIDGDTISLRSQILVVLSNKFSVLVASRFLS